MHVSHVDEIRDVWKDYHPRGEKNEFKERVSQDGGIC